MTTIIVAVQLKVGVVGHSQNAVYVVQREHLQCALVTAVLGRKDVIVTCVLPALNVIVVVEIHYTAHPQMCQLIEPMGHSSARSGRAQKLDDITTSEG